MEFRRGQDGLSGAIKYCTELPVMATVCHDGNTGWMKGGGYTAVGAVSQLHIIIEESPSG